MARNAPIEFVMSQYSLYKKRKYHWCGPPFYTGPGGYKLSIRVDANGWGSGTGTHVSVYAHLMKGEFDDTLTWPFMGDITVQLVSHYDSRNHREWTIPYNEAAVTFGSAQRVTKKERSDKAWGFDKFISHTDVASFNYLLNDCLTFRVTRIIVHA